MPQDDVIEPDKGKYNYRKHRLREITKEEKEKITENFTKVVKEAGKTLEPTKLVIQEIGAETRPATLALAESLNQITSNNKLLGQFTNFSNRIKEIGASAKANPIFVPTNYGLLEKFDSISKGSSALIDFVNKQNAVKEAMANLIVPSINNLRPPDDFFKPKIPDISNLYIGDKIQYYQPERIYLPIRQNINSFDEDDEYISQDVKEYKHKGKDVKITSKPVISFNQKTKTLQIDEVIIKLKGKSRSTDICCAILKSKSKMKKIWAIDEIVEEIGEDIELKKPWPKLIYKSIYDLNRYIELETRIKNFIICTYESLQVNPEHL